MGRVVETGHRPQQRALARAGGPQDREDFPGVYGEREVLLDDVVAVRQGDVLDLDDAVALRSSHA